MGVMTSPSRYPAPAVPDVLSAASSTQVSPAPIREEYSPGTLDVFPTCVASPDMSLYVPATSPVTPVQPLDTEFISPGASMDNLLVGDSSLIDRNQDLPLLPLPLLLQYTAIYGPGAEFCLSCQAVTAGYWYTCCTYAGGVLMYTVLHQTQGTSR